VHARDAAAALAARVKRFRFVAKVWKRAHRFNPHIQNNCKFLLNLFDFFEESRPLSGPERALREAARETLAIAIKQNAAHWKQRGKFRAVKEGDENTKFFHARATLRFRRNNIRVLLVDGAEVVDHHGKAEALRAFYTELLGRARPTAWAFDLDSLYDGAPRVDGRALIAPFDDKEIKAAIWAMDQNSAPGPDGLGPSFYRAAWQQVSPALTELFGAFHAGAADLGCINRAHISLLPKADGILSPSSYRPVSLQNCSMKSVCKALTTRLKSQIGQLIDVNQSGFMTGRSISEIVQCCNRRKAPAVVLKLDFTKAFDSIDWGSLRKVLAARGLPGVTGWMRFSPHLSQRFY
jgi:hypothetical protein